MSNATKKRKAAPKHTGRTLPDYFLYGLLTLLFLFVPFYSVPTALDEAMQPRLLLTAMATLLIALVMLVGRKQFPADYGILRNGMLYLLVAVFLTTCLSLVVAGNVRQGFYEVSKSGTVLVLFTIGALLMKGKTGREIHLVWFALANAVIMLVIAFTQYYQHYLLADWDKIQEWDKISVIYAVKGTLFHKNELATHLMLLLPLVMAGIFAAGKRWKLLFVVVSVLVVVMLVILRTRAVWLGILGGLGVVSVLLVFAYRQIGLQSIFRNVLIVSWVMVLGTGIYVFSLGSNVPEHSPAGRLRSIPNPQSRDNIHRMKIYGSTLAMFKDHPVLGVGPGNWQIKIPAYYNGKFQHFEELSWTRPHNDFLWILSERGIIGFTVWLGVFGLAFFFLLKVLFRSGDALHRILALLFIGGLSAYLGVAFFNFPHERIEHQNIVVIFLISAMLMHGELKRSQGKEISRFWVLLPAIVISLLSVVYGRQALAHEKAIRKAIEARNQGDFQGEARLAMNAGNAFTSLDPMGYPPEFYVAEAQIKANNHREATRYFLKALKHTPNNIQIYNMLGSTYYETGEYEKARLCALRVLDAMPANRQVLINLSAIYYKSGNFRRALLALQQIPEWESDAQLKRNAEFLMKKIQE